MEGCGAVLQGSKAALMHALRQRLLEGDQTCLQEPVRSCCGYRPEASQLSSRIWFGSEPFSWHLTGSGIESHRQLGINVGAMSQELCHSVRMPLDRGLMQGGHAMLIRSIDIGTAVLQQLHQLHVALQGCQVQRCPATLRPCRESFASLSAPYSSPVNPTNAYRHNALQRLAISPQRGT